MKKYLVIILIAGISFVSCDPQKKIAGNYSYETECLGSEMDGSQTVKAWGVGNTVEDAVEQAKKNAVRDVLFKGIRKGKPECELRPVLPEVNAQENHAQYFYTFFADNGPYKNFVSNKDGTFTDKKMMDGDQKGSNVQYGVTVRVLRSALIKRMIDDGILKQ